MSWRRGLEHAVTTAEVAAAICLLAVTGRFAGVGLSASVTRWREEQNLGPAEVVERVGNALLSPREPRSDGLTREERPRAASARMTVLVTAGTPRSDVFVNGVKRGKTPYVGEVECLEGEPIKVDILSEKGAPLSSTHPCVSGGTLRVAD